MIEKITSEELELVECMCYPPSAIACVFSDLDNFLLEDEKKFAKIRPAQEAVLSFEYMIDDDPNNNVKENFQLKIKSGSIECFGGRKWGKTYIVEKVDIFMTLFWLEGEHIGFTSIDALHIRGVLEEIINTIENHTLFKSFEFRVNRSPNYRISNKAGYLLESINMNVLSRNPGQAFFQKHLKRLYIEEACVDGHTKIRYFDKNNNIKTKNISELINSEEYKEIELLTYNHNKKIIERKQVKKAFKKQVKNSEVYKIILDDNVSSNNRTLIVSDKHRCFVNDTYKLAKDIKINDNMLLLDESELTDIQKSIVVGCLLGDSHVNQKQRKSISLSFTNSIKQKEFIEYKKHCFQSFFDVYRKTKNNRNIYKTIKSWGNIIRFTTKECSAFNEFRDFKYNKVGNFYTKVNKEILYKYFNEISFAFFIMDDGSINTYNCKKSSKVNNYIQLHTEAFDLETQQLLLDVIKDKFNIKGSICKNKQYYYLAFDSENTNKIINLVKDYIHPSILYKVNKKSNNFINLKCENDILKKTKVIDIRKEIKSSWTMYCFEVEDNNNFFANGLLTGNSLETDQVFSKRNEAVSEVGCVVRSAGMTNFTKYSPAGRRFYDVSNKDLVCNLPQYVSPAWNKKEKERAVREHGGESSISYRIFVKGEIVEDGVCVAKGSKILMSDFNIKNIEDVNINDKIFAFDENTPRKFKESLVINKKCNGFKEIINIKSGDNELSLTPDHKVLAFSRKSYKWVDIETCLKRKYKILSLHNHFNILEDYLWGCLIGLIESDGNWMWDKNKKNYNVYITQSLNCEWKTIEWLLKELNIKYSRYYVKHKTNPNFNMFRYCLKRIHNDKLNETKRKILSDKNIDFGFLCGFILGDGYFHKSGFFGITQSYKTNKEKCLLLENIFKKYNIKYNKHSIEEKQINCYSINKLHLFPYLKNSYKVDKFKNELFNSFLCELSKEVTEVSREKKEVYDLQTTTGTFIANNFLVHNCVFDMIRVRGNYLENKVIKHFEVSKDNFVNYKEILIVDRPKGVDEVYICADIGETAATEIIVMFKIKDTFFYHYNITCYNLTDKQQSDIFFFLISQLEANVIGIDTTDGTGRAILRKINEIVPIANLVACSFNEKLSIDFDKDDKGLIKFDNNGRPLYKEEYVSEWSVNRLKHLFYDGRIKCPIDYKLDKQMNSVIANQTASRTVYTVASEEDHLFSAFRVFAISVWQKEFAQTQAIKSKKFGKIGS